MKPTKKNQAAMEATAIDHMLAAEEELVPSSGFVASVMERVQEEAALPPPIPFPWKRAVPGVILAAGVFGWGAVELFREGGDALRGFTLSAPHLPAAWVPGVEEAGWIALALAASLASWLFSRRLAGRSGLL
jgi:hypothetical protein